MRTDDEGHLSDRCRGFGQSIRNSERVRFQRTDAEKADKNVLTGSPLDGEARDGNPQRVRWEDLDPCRVKSWVVEKHGSYTPEDAEKEQDDGGNAVGTTFSQDYCGNSLAVKLVVSMPEERSEEEESHDDVDVVESFVREFAMNDEPRRSQWIYLPEGRE